jgi:hypothetical protein
MTESSSRNDKSTITLDSYEGDGSIDTAEMEDVMHAVAVETRQHQKPSNLSCYKEVTTFKSWFEQHVAHNSRTTSAKSLVAELCGLNMRIYYRSQDEQQNGKRHKDLFPVNKIATVLTFDPNSGLYNHLIRGKAYVVFDNADTRVTKRTVWAIQELISQHKEKYHEYGADFSRQGQMELLKACVQFKKGNWVPRSVYGMALSKSDAAWEAVAWPEEHEGAAAQDPSRMKLDEVDEAVQSLSASQWFIASCKIDD